jgi:cell wall-associated NlpC family hydrolase
VPRTTSLAIAAAAALALAGCAAVSRPGAAASGSPVAPSPEASGPDVETLTSLAAPGAPSAGAPDAAGVATAPAEPVAPPAEGNPRLVERALALLGTRGPFRVGRDRFRDDCSGFVAAVFTADGLDLRAAMQRAGGGRGAAAAWRAAGERGGTFGAEEAPAPGDLVFWNDTYDRNHNRKPDDGFTHVGLVERVVDGTVVFLHRGHRGVARGFMTLARRHEARDADGTVLNSAVQRPHAYPVRKGGGLAAELFAGFAHLEGLPAAAGGLLQARTPRPAGRPRRDAHAER